MQSANLAVATLLVATAPGAVPLVQLVTLGGVLLVAGLAGRLRRPAA